MLLPYLWHDLLAIQIFSEIMAGEISTLSVNKKGFASLKTTIPMSLIKQWDLKPHDKLSWKWKVIDGDMVVVVTKYDDAKSTSKKPIKKN